jgi:D-threo-aldose 1-dehydrogenase
VPAVPDASLPRLGIGTAPFAGIYAPVDEADTSAAVAEALRVGASYFDTAPLYGAGVAEERLGAALAGCERSSFRLSSKVGRVLEPRPASQPRDTFFRNSNDLVPVFDFSYDAVRRSLESSLERLRSAYLDLALIHDPDDHFEAALGEAYPALERLRDEGLVRAVGLGMNQSAMLTEFVRRVRIDHVLVAGRYTLLDQEALASLLPACSAAGTRVVIGGVFNSGALANPRAGGTYDYHPASPEVLARARALEEVCERHGVSLRAAAMQFPLAHPAVATVLVGCRGASEVRENAASFAARLPPALWDALRSEGLLADDVPTPGAAPGAG